MTDTSQQDLDEEGGTNLLPLFRDIVAVEHAIYEVGDKGIAYSDIHEHAEHSDLTKSAWFSFGEYVLADSNWFEQHPNTGAIRATSSDSAGSQLI